MGSSSATPPDGGNASGPSDDVGSFFLRLKFQMAMIHKIIKKLLQETSAGGGDTPEIRDLKTGAAELANKLNALRFEISEVWNPFIPNFLHLDPRLMVIALKHLEKGNFDALISGFGGFSEKIEEIEKEIRSFFAKSAGVSEYYASILYIRVRSVIHKEHLETRSRFLQFVEEKEEMKRLKAQFEARKAELEELERRLGKLEKEYLGWEIGDLGEEIGDLETRLREFRNALHLSGDQDLGVSSLEDEFGEKIGDFGEELNEIGDKVFMASFELDEAKKKQNPSDMETLSGAKESTGECW